MSASPLSVANPSRLFWLTILLAACGEFYKVGSSGFHHLGVFALGLLIAFIVPAAALWWRAASGFMPVGYNPKQPATLQRARTIGFAGPLAVFFYFAYLAKAAQQIEVTLLYGACTILIAVSQQWLYYRLRRIERSTHSDEPDDDPTAHDSPTTPDDPAAVDHGAPPAAAPR
ncbi:hypothetical protein [Brevibacterium gallinarum]|uniref:DUF2568 domain-containing protein n=1 Tax=Brevibacterium gallinarum TaxID=2762220 RepID=A0ABR8WR91_9MICO|nr:hypothetical protein [Brevibacterium gallinarum]MBD8019221.1 hypothetical protein [Brevibacterium gallinarum]